MTSLNKTTATPGKILFNGSDILTVELFNSSTTGAVIFNTSAENPQIGPGDSAIIVTAKINVQTGAGEILIWTVLNPALNVSAAIVSGEE